MLNFAWAFAYALEFLPVLLIFGGQTKKVRLLILVVVLISLNMGLITSNFLKTVLVCLLLFFYFISLKIGPLAAFTYTGLPFLIATILNFVKQPLISSLLPFMSWESILFLSVLWELVLATLFCLLIKQIQNRLEETKRWLLDYLLSVLSMLGLFIYIWQRSIGHLIMVDSPQLLAYAVAGLVLSLLLLTYSCILANQRNLMEQSRLFQERIQLEESQKYYQSLAKNVDQIRSFRHDFQNICLGLQLAIEEENLDEIKRYFNNTILKQEQALEKVNLTFANLEKITCPPIKSLVYSKLGVLDFNKVKIILDIDLDLTFHEKDLPILIRSLGILLDNAIEEIATQSTGTLRIGFKRIKDDTLVIVDNSCGETLPLHSLKEKGFSTKGPDRGLGLSNLAELLSSDRFELMTQIRDYRFKQTIRICKEGE